MQGTGVQSLVQELTSPVAWPKQKQYEKWRGRQAFMIRDYCRRPMGFSLHHPIDPNIFLMSNRAFHIQWITFSIFYFPSNKADFLRDCGLSKVYAFCLEPSSFSCEFSSSFKTQLGSLRRSLSWLENGIALLPSGFCVPLWGVTSHMTVNITDPKHVIGFILFRMGHVTRTKALHVHQMDLTARFNRVASTEAWRHLGRQQRWAWWNVFIRKILKAGEVTADLGTWGDLCDSKAGPQPNSTSITQFSSVQSLSHNQLFATPWTAACQASLSITSITSNTRELLKCPLCPPQLTKSEHILLRSPSDL